MPSGIVRNSSIFGQPTIPESAVCIQDLLRKGRTVPETLRRNDAAAKLISQRDKLTKLGSSNMLPAPHEASASQTVI
jgi:hypothetical protein